MPLKRSQDGSSRDPNEPAVRLQRHETGGSSTMSPGDVLRARHGLTRASIAGFDHAAGGPASGGRYGVNKVAG